MEFTKNVHYSPDLEAAVLGVCMLEKTAFGRTHGILRPEMLYGEANKVVFQALTELYSTSLPIDLLTVTDRIMRVLKVQELAGDNVPYYLTKLTNDVVHSAHMEYHCYILKGLWMEREVIKLTSGGLKLDGDVTQQLIQIQTAIRDINSGDYTKEWSDMTELMMDLVKHQEKMESAPDSCIKSGIADLDDKNGGFFPGNLIVIGARPGAGKSAFMGQLAMNIARKKKKVGIISLEMNNTEIAGRLASLDTGMDFQQIFRSIFSDELQRERFMEKISRSTSELPIFISDKTRATTIDIRAKADKLKALKGLDFLFIDYLQLVSADQPKNKTRENIISEISRSCKIMAKELQIPVCILCQLNRDSMKRQGESRYPQLNDLRESGAIEQDADIVMFVHRDWVVGVTQDKDGGSTENQADLLVRKWRNAEPNLHVKMEFDGPRMAFKFQRTSEWKPIKAIMPDTDYTNDNPF